MNITTQPVQSVIPTASAVPAVFVRLLLNAWCALALMISLPIGALAEDIPSSPLEVTLTAFRILSVDGRETREATTEAAPGDIIEYSAVFRNTSADVLKNVKPTLPIPAGTIYQEGSAFPKKFLASLDGATFRELPLKREVVEADGRRRFVDVSSTEFRTLRWAPTELKPGEAVNVRARVRVDSDTSSNADS